VERELPAKYMQFIRYGIDIRKEPMLIYPTLHYQNGGIKISPKAETAVPGLYAAGETTGGVHGENRLMGNSLLDVTVFGRIAGASAAAWAREAGEGGRPTLDHVRAHNREVATLPDGRDAVAPMLLPDYIPARVKDRQLTSRYLGTLR
jgi:succinate dehydrogenase/fumarate reductase flavoprotein subunit